MNKNNCFCSAKHDCAGGCWAAVVNKIRKHVVGCTTRVQPMSVSGRTNHAMHWFAHSELAIAQGNLNVKSLTYRSARQKSLDWQRSPGPSVPSAPVLRAETRSPVPAKRNSECKRRTLRLHFSPQSRSSSGIIQPFRLQRHSISVGTQSQQGDDTSLAMRRHSA